MQKKALTLEKKHKKHSSPSKKPSHRKKAQKSTTVLLKALATIPESRNLPLTVTVVTLHT